MPIHLLEYLGVEPGLQRRHILAWWRVGNCRVISPFDNREVGDLIVVALIRYPLRLQ